MRLNFSLLVGVALCGLAPLGGCAHSTASTPTSLDARFRIGPVLYTDDFQHGLVNWFPELESGGTVEARDGKLEIDVPRGCTVWFKPEITGPVLIEYDATVVSAGGLHDRVSDLNCFWMAQDARSPGNIFATKRSGRFADYDQLLTYYVGQGGNTNTTTRFRRYIGVAANRPILPGHDLSEAQFLLQPNVKQKISLVACGNLIQYYRDGRKIFEYNDPAPYTRGWFALRTTQNHMVVENFSIRRLVPVN